MSVKAAFIFIAPETNPEQHSTVIDSPVVKLHVVGVKTYEEAAKVAVDLASDGVKCVELCGGFGSEGTAMVSKAVKGLATVGVVRFDGHPGFDFKSGDEVFA